MRSLDIDTIVQAADYSDKIYNSPSGFDHSVGVDQFALVNGTLMGSVKLATGGCKTTYVVFRGTDSHGNWGLTNFQAYMTEFGLLDSEIQARSSGSSKPAFRRFQGINLAFPIQGKVHQGFYRASSYLWYGTEPPFDTRSDEAGPYQARLKRELKIFSIFSALGVAAGLKFRRRDFVYGGVIAGLTSDLLLIGLERGTWEGLLRKKPRVSGQAARVAPVCPETGRRAVVLSSLRKEFISTEADETRKLVFCGHSLGGALALLSFCMYQAWCESQGLKSRAYLVTFGSPRVGDKAFVQDFQTKYGDSYWNIIVNGDPVSETPPAEDQDLDPNWLKTPAGLGLTALKSVWPVYSQSWGQEPVGIWGRKVQLGNADGYFSGDRHNIRSSYLRLLKQVPTGTAIYPDATLPSV